MDERKVKIYNKIRNEAITRGNKVEFVSFSKLEKFLKCKRCFKYMYIDKYKIEYKDNLHADVGTICHDIIEWSSTENWSRDKIINTFNERARNICNKYSMRVDIPLVQSTKHFFTDSNFMNTIYERGVEVEFEVPVYHKLKYDGEPNKEYWLVGFIDMVVHNEDGSISIVDFKTSNTSGYTGKKKEQAFLQIYSYAYLYEALYRNRVKDVAWLFIKYCNMSFVDSKGKNRKSSKVERRNIKEEFRTKNGVDSLEITDCLDTYEYTKDNRLVYIKKLIDIFNDTKSEGMFEASDRDKYYCDKFCPYRDGGVCDWEDKEEYVNPMMVLLQSVCKI